MPRFSRLSLTPVLLAIGLLLLPGSADAKKRKPAPHAAGSLSDLTTQASGSFGRVSSGDLTSDAVLGPGESLVLAQIEGPAVIDRIWVAIEGSDTYWRDVVLQITWDGGAAPSVESPIGDFFVVGPGARQNVQSVPVAVQSGGRAMTALWKMPFGVSARIALVNEGANATRQLMWEVDYRRLEALPPGSLYFHAQYTQGNPPESGRPLTVLRAAGRGQFVGLSVVAQNVEPGAWGTGGVHFDIDGGTAGGPGSLSLLNYFGHVFGVSDIDGPYQGCTLDEGDRVKARSAVYRFHVNDPVPFADSIVVEIDHGVENKRTDRISAVAYWYQDQPAVPFERLASARDRRWPSPSDEELALWRRADEINKQVIEAYRRLDYDEALQLLEELLGLEPASVYASYNLACLYALEGQSDKALHLLQQAIDLGFTELSFARHDPDLQSLHGFERFRKLVRMPEPPDGG